MKKNKMTTIIYFLVSVIVVLILIPLMINYCLDYNLITSFETDSSDWLSFWGSFLGGIVGGLATLLGVRYTIRQMEEENRIKNRPVVMPYKVNYTIDIQGDKHKIRNYIPRIDEKIINDYKDENKIYSAHIYLINISLHNALNVTVNWDKPKIEEINKCIGKISNKTKSIIEEIKKLESIRNNVNIPLIRSAESNGLYEISLYGEMKKCIFLLLELYEYNDDDFHNLPVGTFEIVSHDIYGEKFTDRFKIYMTVQCSSPKITYDVKIEFYKLKKNE